MKGGEERIEDDGALFAPSPPMRDDDGQVEFPAAECAIDFKMRSNICDATPSRFQIPRVGCLNIIYCSCSCPNSQMGENKKKTRKSIQISHISLP